MKIWLIRLIYISLLLNIGCSSTSTKENKVTTMTEIDKQIVETLALKYNEVFEIDTIDFNKLLNLYTYTAHPHENPNIQFIGVFYENEKLEKKKLQNDDFPDQKFSHQAGEYFESLFPNKELKHIAQASIKSKYEHRFGTIVPELDEYLADRKADSSIRFNSYFFTIPDQPYHQTIVTLFGVMETLHEKFKNDYAVYGGFWDKDFLRDKNLANLTFGFESSTKEDSDNQLTVDQYLAKEVYLKITYGSLEGLDEEKMFELLKDYNKNESTPMVEI